MTRFAELAPTLALEADVLAFWDQEQIYQQSLDHAAKEGLPSFTFYEGPPTANGTPHNGHVLTRVIKDLVCRYWAMKGHRVARRAGWDTHGLPVEVEVEKTLGILGKAAIEAYGLEKFAHACRESVFQYTKEWEDLTRRIGFWVDLDQAYVTYHRAYVESVWWCLAELYRKGLLYRGHKVVWWWPQGGTALSSAEVGLGYKTVEDPSVVCRFPATEGGLTFLAWTTTPWTLPSNVALAVNAALRYAVVERDGQRFVIAERRAGDIEGGTVVRTLAGSELVGQRYTPPFRFAEPDGGDAFRIVAADFVTDDSGTGIVHLAPAFGIDDFDAAKANGLGMLQLVAPDGTFVAGTGFLEGQNFKAADKLIIRDLESRGLLQSRASYRHDYPFCWRADSDPLMQYARPAWFIRTTSRKDASLKNNDAIAWVPQHIQDGRFGDFLRNNVDWALSRERFWGTPLPIWQCQSCDHEEAISSTAEIQARNPDAFDPSVDADMQVHRPWVDRITLPCPKCGGTMHRVKEVIDVWFDSGSMPFAQWGFPHKNIDAFKASFPADFITEAVDQTRGWFYSLHMIGTLLFDNETAERYGLPQDLWPRPFRNCVVLGHVCDAAGVKESKSKGNYTPPDLVLRGEMRLKVQADPALKPGQAGFKLALVKNLNLTADERLTVVGRGLALEVVEADVKVRDTFHMAAEDLAALGNPRELALAAPFDPLGADAFRWLFSVSSPWSNTRLSIGALREGQREFLIRLRNVYGYFTIYANLLKFDPATTARPAITDDLDRWILGELDATILAATAAMDRYVFHEAARAIQDFVEALSNWWVRRSRRRFWGEGTATDAALFTLYDVLQTLTRLIAPFVPFLAEALYRALNPGAALPSVHMTRWPVAQEATIDRDLQARMNLVRRLASLGLQARNMVQIKTRQPLAALDIVLADQSLASGLTPLLGLLQDEVNVRAVRFADDATRFVDYRVQPNWKKLGPKFGAHIKTLKGVLADLPQADAQRLAMGGTIDLVVEGTAYTLSSDDIAVTVQAKGSYGSAGSADAVVALDPTIDADLAEEGLAREITSRIQGLRKERDLGYADRIRLVIAGSAAVQTAARRFQDYIAEETLATGYEVVADLSGDAVDRSDANGEALVLRLDRA
jgi:isoleucyl-tRNA synthetase